LSNWEIVALWLLPRRVAVPPIPRRIVWTAARFVKNYLNIAALDNDAQRKLFLTMFLRVACIDNGEALPEQA
jgi:hypothetical protein